MTRTTLTKVRDIALAAVTLGACSVIAFILILFVLGIDLI